MKERKRKIQQRQKMNITSLDELQWKSPEWIQTFGLRTDNVIDYFSESPFFDKTSNNYVIKMQRQFVEGERDGENTNGEYGYISDGMRRDIMERYPIHKSMEMELNKMDGIEYVLIMVKEPDFWIIRKQRREHGADKGSPKFEVLKDYYIIGANVYQSPSVYKVIKNRLMSTGYNLGKIIDGMNELIHFEPSQGMQFKARSKETVKTVQSQSQTHGPGTVMLNSVGDTVQSSPYDSVHKETLTGDMMDKLLTTSIRSDPEYI